MRRVSSKRGSRVEMDPRAFEDVLCVLVLGKCVCIYFDWPFYRVQRNENNGSRTGINPPFKGVELHEEVLTLLSRGCFRTKSY